GLEVDLFDVERRLLDPANGLPDPVQADEELDHIVAAEDRPPRGRRLAAAVAPHADVAREQRGQRRAVAARDAPPDALRHGATRSATARCDSGVPLSRGRRSARRAFARCSSCREFSAVVPSISAISAWSYSKTSLSRKTARSSGESVSSRTRNASVTDSARC